MQVVASTKVACGVKESIQELADVEHKTVSQVIKDALHAYALRQCELYLIGLESGALKHVEAISLDKMRVYRDLAQSFER